MRAIADAMREVRRKLLHLADDIPLAALDQHGIILTHHLVTVMLSRLAVGAGSEILLNLAENPWIRRCGAADHHGIASGFAHHTDRVFGRDDIAIADHR